MSLSIRVLDDQRLQFTVECSGPVEIGRGPRRGNAFGQVIQTDACSRLVIANRGRADGGPRTGPGRSVGPEPHPASNT